MAAFIPAIVQVGTVLTKANTFIGLINSVLTGGNNKDIANKLNNIVSLQQQTLTLLNQQMAEAEVHFFIELLENQTSTIDTNFSLMFEAVNDDQKRLQLLSRTNTGLNDSQIALNEFTRTILGPMNVHSSLMHAIVLKVSQLSDNTVKNLKVTRYNLIADYYMTMVVPYFFKAAAVMVSLGKDEDREGTAKRVMEKLKTTLTEAFGVLHKSQGSQNNLDDNLGSLGKEGLDPKLEEKDIGIEYVDFNDVVADPGNAVVGVGLYLSANRLALQIQQASIDAGDKTSMRVSVKDISWKKSGWGDNYLTFSNDRNYIDTVHVHVKPGHVLTGVRFYQKANRLAINIQNAPLKFERGENGLNVAIDDSKREWLPQGSDVNNDEYFTGREKVTNGYFKAVGMDVSTDPPSLLSGVRLTHQGMFDSRLSYPHTQTPWPCIGIKILTDITSPDSIEAWLGPLTN
jgi:hypothetical protein